MNVYIALTKEFNAGGLRAVISSGQAVVLHRLAIMSTYGDWILREDAPSLAHVLTVLSERGARYRFGAPLDARWMSGGWSSHFEFRRDKLRVRTDFVTRPPRISSRRLEALWRGQEGRELPFVNAKDLADLKKTSREIDYPIIGELARLMTDVRDQFLYSRSPRDLISLHEKHPALAGELVAERPALGSIGQGRRRLQEALDAERYDLRRVDEERLAAYMQAAKDWSASWPEIRRQTRELPLPQAHEIIVKRADGVLPFRIDAFAREDPPRTVRSP